MLRTLLSGTWFGKEYFGEVKKKGNLCWQPAATLCGTFAIPTESAMDAERKVKEKGVALRSGCSAASRGSCV